MAWLLAVFIVLLPAGCVVAPQEYAVDVPAQPERAVGSAYAEIEGDTSTAYLERSGKKIRMHQFTVPPSESALWKYQYNHFRFSPSGRYVLFEGYGWEWMDGFVFDTEKATLVAKISTPDFFDITPDEQSLYSCASNFFSGEQYGRVTRLKDGRVLIDIVPLITLEDENDYPLQIRCSMVGQFVSFSVDIGNFLRKDTVMQTYDFIIDPANGSLISQERIVHNGE